jgi:GNAT superfamily N-acetyltransferase
LVSCLDFSLAQFWGPSEPTDAEIRNERIAIWLIAIANERTKSALGGCWIAERDGESVGSVLLVKKSRSVAKLRLLLVEPSAPELGIGKRLVAEFIRFARDVGYKKIMLWTQCELAGARRIYQNAGFEMVAGEKHRSWSRNDLVAETWELRL